MLVLSRHRNGKITFPTLGISIEVVRIARNKVQLGIAAPANIPVHREEVARRLIRGDPHDGNTKRA